MQWSSAGSLQASDVTFTVLHPAPVYSGQTGRKEQDVELNFPRLEWVTLASFCLPSTDAACLFVWLRWTESPYRWCHLTHFFCITFTRACKVGRRSSSRCLKPNVFAPLVKCVNIFATTCTQNVPTQSTPGVFVFLFVFFLVETKLRCSFPLPQSAKHGTVSRL